MSLKNVKICSMNVRGLGNEEKRRDVFNWLKKKNHAIYCLQDIHVGDKNKTAFCKDWGSEVILSAVSTESRGVAILFNENLDYKLLSVDRDDRGNLLVLELELQLEKLLLVVIYGPNSDNPVFHNDLKQRLLKFNDVPMIICGDWNLVLDYSVDTHGYIRENNVKAK